MSGPRPGPAGPGFRLESRPDGSLLVTWPARAPGAAVAGALALIPGVLLLAATLTGGVTVLGGVLTLPLGVILVLASWGAIRHRDWVLFDRPGRQVLHRQGLVAIFRAAGTLPFDDVEGIRVERVDGEGRRAILLRCAGGGLWALGRGVDPGAATELVARVRAVGGWPVEGETSETGHPSRVRGSR